MERVSGTCAFLTYIHACSTYMYVILDSEKRKMHSPHPSPREEKRNVSLDITTYTSFRHDYIRSLRCVPCAENWNSQFLSLSISFTLSAKGKKKKKKECDRRFPLLALHSTLLSSSSCCKPPHSSRRTPPRPAAISRFCPLGALLPVRTKHGTTEGQENQEAEDALARRRLS